MTSSLFGYSAHRKQRDDGRSGDADAVIQAPKGKRRFVIQKHAARQLHYDFRLEIEGVLVSWAVPKGLSTKTSVKRLAIQTDDHPLQYADFEGVISAGQYGAGTVMIWDKGYYRNLRGAPGKGRQRRSMAAALAEGLLEVWLEGNKLQGGYALKRIGKGDKPQWLVFKMKGKKADG